MKKIKILGICSVLAVLLTACNPANTSDSSSSNLGDDFTYTHPSTSIQEDYVIDINYGGNDLIKNKLAEVKADNTKLSELLGVVASNPLVPTHGQAVIKNLIKYDLNKDGNLDNDLGNLDVTETYTFARDNESHSKSGTIKYLSKVVAPKEGGEPTIVNKNIQDGTYSLTVDTHKYNIHEVFDFHDKDLNKESDYFLNETNLRKNMQVVNLDKFQEKLNSNYSSWKNDTENVKLTSTSTDTSITVKLEKIQILETIKITQTYEIEFANEGYVLSASYKNISESETDTAGTYDKVLENHQVNYTFSL